MMFEMSDVSGVQENIKTFAAIFKPWKSWNLCLTEQKSLQKYVLYSKFPTKPPILYLVVFFFRQSSHHGCQVSGIFVGQADKLDHKLSENFTPSWSIGGPGFFHNDIPSNLPHDFWSTQSSNPPNQKNPQARLKPRLPMTITGSKNQCSFATDVTGIQIWTLAKFWPQASMGDDLPPSTPVTSVDMSYTITTSQKKNM